MSERPVGGKEERNSQQTRETREAGRERAIREGQESKKKEKQERDSERGCEMMKEKSIIRAPGCRQKQGEARRQKKYEKIEAKERKKKRKKEKPATVCDSSAVVVVKSQR